MKVCSNCFLDVEIIAFVDTSNEKGNCTVCNALDKPIMELLELYDFFQELTTSFRLVSEGMTLSSRIQSDWNLFRSSGIADKILSFVLPVLQTEITSSSQFVDYSDEIIATVDHWETLKEELKWKNRFVIDIHRLGREEFKWNAFLEDINTQLMLTNSTQLFRARIHDKSGLPVYDKGKMGCPEKEIASAGRANPAGIPFLYLCEDDSTALYEVRASYLDEVSIATFQLREDIHSVQLVDFTKESPLFQRESIKSAISGKLLRNRISKELSKPLRRYDSELEYIPTQFICEYIKEFTVAKGIRFRSSLNSDGYNIVFFEPELFECKSVKKVSINSTMLTSLDVV